MTDVLFLHWGWATPGVPRCNRDMQEGKYLRFLDAERDRGSCFMITQPAWALDCDMSAAVRRTTTGCPEPERHNGPFAAASLESLREAVAEQRVCFVIYPYSGAVVEGMAGEAVLATMRLARDIAADKLGIAVRDFFIHDGITKLNWNVPAVLSVARLLGLERLYGTFNARLTAPDGSELSMYGDLLGGGFEFRRSEMPHGPEAIGELREELGDVNFLTLPEALERLGEPEREVLAARTYTKGWYGGAPRSLEMQAALRRHDLLLPWVTALAAVRGEGFDPTDHWKRSLIMQDTHLQWFLCDWPCWYLPRARELETELHDHFGGTGDTVTNVLPFARSGVVETEGDCRFVESVPPLSTVALTTVAASVEVGEDLLANSRIRVDIGPTGEIEQVTTTAGETLYAGRGNRVCRRHLVADDRPVALRLGDTWNSGFTGNLELFTEVDVPSAGYWQFELDCPCGMTIAIGPEDADWTSATNLHWGGGQPSANRDPEYTGVGAIYLPAGRVCLRLYAVADQGFRLDRAVLRRGRERLELGQWQGRTTNRWVEDPFVVERVEPVARGARGELRFYGHFAVCSACLTLRLDHDSDRVDVRFERDYPETVYEGFATAPLPPEIGSYLGSTCERPYAPAWTVETATWPGRTVYTSDKPYGFAPATDQDDAWFTSRFRDWFAGVAPFLGVFTGVAEAPDGRVAIISDGHGHFCRCRVGQDEALGLSLGASIIHPMTQGYRMAPGSYWEKIGRRPGGHDYEHAYEDGGMTRVEGGIAVGWSLLFGPAVADRRHLWAERLAANIPLVPGGTPRQTDLALSAADIVLVALERRDGAVVARVLNLADEPREYRLAHPWGPALTGVLPPTCLEEVRLDGDD